MRFPPLVSLVRAGAGLLVFLAAPLLRAVDAPDLAVAPWNVPPLPASAAGGFVHLSHGALIAAAGAEPAPLVAATIFPERAEAGWKFSDVTVPRWAAAARAGDRLFLAGGLVDGRPTSRVIALEAKPDGALAVTELPPLPQAVAGAGAAVLDGQLVVFGGVSALEPPVFERRLWQLDLAAGPGAAWEEGPTFPGAGRAFFAAGEQQGAFCVFGGLVSGDGGVATSPETWTFRVKPVEASTRAGWARMADLPEARAGAAALPIGQGGMLVLGGAPRATLLPETAGAAPTTHPLLYHTITDAWTAFAHVFPAADPLAVRLDGGAALVGVGDAVSQRLSFPRSVRSLAWADYLVIIAYFGLLAGIGFYFSKQESSEEFSLGNRNVKWWAAGISMFATGASAISFMAIPALAFATNLVWTLPLIAFIPAYFINAYLIFPLLRRMEITSTYEYLERRFNKPLRLIASAQCIVIQTFGRTSVVLVLPAIAISAVTGMDVFLSVLLMGVLTTIYTSVGGFESVIWTEVFQGILKLIAPIVMIVFAILSLPGGMSEFWQTSVTLHKTDSALLTWDVAVPALWILLLGTMLTSTIGTAGDQPIIQRVFSTPLNAVRRLTMTSIVCSIVIGVIVNVLGLAIFAYFRAHPEQFAPTATNDQIVPLFVTQAMPAGFAGVIIAAIFASAMATVASAMNSVATIYAADFYPLLRPRATDAQRLRTLKITSYVVGAVGTAMALLLAATNPVSLMVVWAQIVSLLGGGVVGVYSLGMFTTRVNGFGAVCGALASIVITLLVKLFTDLHWATYMPIAILSCMLCGYVFSLFAPQRKNLSGLTVFTPVDSSDTAVPLAPAGSSLQT